MASLGPLIVELAPRTERRERKARCDALGHADDVGIDAEVIDREPAPGAAEPALHLVGDEHDAVLAATLDDALEEGLRRRDVATLTQHRFDDHGRGLGRRGLGEQQAVERPQRCIDRRLLIARQGIREGRHEHAARQRRVAGAIDRLRGRHRHREVGATMERPLEHDDVLALGDLLGQLDRRLRDLGAGVREEEGVDAGRRDVVQLRRQRLHQVVCEHVGLSVYEPFGLGRDRGGDLGVAVAGRVDGDARREIEVLVTIGGGDTTSPARGDLEIGHLEPHVREVRHIESLDSAPYPPHTPRRPAHVASNATTPGSVPGHIEAARASASSQLTDSSSGLRNGIT